jgi:IMP and pyridine-specific 5'-nucleotidase
MTTVAIPQYPFSLGGALTQSLVLHQNDAENPFPSKLKLLVPSIGPFFTRLPLEAAFKFQDRKRYISSRRFVSPSFNDVRLILNSAQIMAVTTYGTLQLATFDGDVTLYDDGQSLEPTSPVIPRLMGTFFLVLHS